MNQTTQPYILVLGVSICDIFGFTYNSYRTHDSNPGSVKISFGGVCRNIAENLARVGTPTKFITILGEDEKGKAMLEHAKSTNVDMSASLVAPGVSTPTYMAILDELGEMVSAIVDVNVDELMTKQFIDDRQTVIENAEYMILGAENPDMMAYLLENYHKKTKFILDPVSAAKAQKLVHLIPYFHTVKPNRHEAEVLVGFKLDSIEDIRKAGRAFLNKGVTNVFISLDADGVYFNNGIEEGIVKTSGITVKNVTGAGDAFLAGIGYGYMNNVTIIDAIKFAQTMSIITISHEDTIHPQLNESFVKSQMNAYQWDVTMFDK